MGVGDRDGDSVILIFAAPPGAGTRGRPIKSLVAFERVHTRVGETQAVSLDVPAQHFTLAEGLGHRRVELGQWKLWVGVDGESSPMTVTVM